MSKEVGGFWQAFLQTGAPALIATLVLVDPGSVQQLILEFYKNLLAGNITEAEALRQAQLKLRKERREGYHWSSYILIVIIADDVRHRSDTRKRTTE